MLRDKDVGGVLRELAPRITRWHLASLAGPRAAAAAELAAQLGALGVARASIHAHESPAQAFAAAREGANENDKIVVFGSFLTVGEVKAWLNDNKTSKR
jgi:dihydrofolate synthase/folylpolyglutamate synthase